MNISDQDQEALDLINKSSKIAILVSKFAGVDEVASLMALYHVLTADGKQVVPVVSEQVPNACLGLPESSQIKNDLGPKNLVVKLDVKEGSVDSISYSDEDESVFELTIHPATENFVITNISYAYSGFDADLFIVLGVQSLDQLGPPYLQNTSAFQSTPVLSISTKPVTKEFADVAVMDAFSSNISGLLFNKLSLWGFRPSPAAAESLLIGMKYGSKRDAYPASSEVKPVVEQKKKVAEDMSPYPEI